MTTFQVPYMPSADRPEPTPEEKLVAYRKLFEKVLNPKNRLLAASIHKNKESHERNKEYVKLLEPLMPRINQLTGQENLPAFMGYALEWVMDSYKGDPFRY